MFEHFKEAHNQGLAGHDAALAELRSGRKRGHWIWYVFPQLAGLGSSGMAERFALRNVDEAVEYLRDEMLAHRYLAAATAVAEQVMKGNPLRRLMGSEIDALKLVSSLTLFESAAHRLCLSGADETHQSIVHAAEDVLHAAEGQELPRCAFTLGALNRG